MRQLAKPAKLERKNPEFTVRSAGFEPLEPYPGNNHTPWRCIHLECENEVTIKLGSITAGKNPCKYCNGQWVNPDRAVEVMRQAGLEPLEPYVSNKHSWRCRCLTCGKEVTPRYNSVLSNGSSCKYCGKSSAAAKRRILEEDARLFMLSKGYEPLEPYVNSRAKWRCIHLSCGREVLTDFSQIRAGHGACRHCASLIVEPESAVEVMHAAGYEPLEPYVNSKHKWRCQCLVCGRETTPTYDEAKRGSRCKYCARKAVTEEDAIAIMQGAGFEPIVPFPGSMRPWLSRHLSCGEIMSPRYAHVQQGRRACKTCSLNFMADLFRLDPIEAEVIMRAAELEPLEPYPGNQKPWRCIHIPCGKEVAPTRASISQGQGGCKECGQKRIAALFAAPDDVAVSTMREAGFEPLFPYPGRSHAPWECRCTTCERISTPTLSNTKNGARCIYCAGRKVKPDEADAFMRRSGLVPLEPYPGRNSADWKCFHEECGREVITRYSTVRTGNSGCNFCSGNRIHPDDALALMKERGLDPLEPFPGYSNPWKCVHEQCGKQVTPTYANVASGGSGCKFCSDSSFAYEAPGVLYLLQHDEFQAIKVGITTTAARTNRIRDHERGGWTLISKWDTPTGLDAELIEQAVLYRWRIELGAPIAVRKEEMPSGGFTETATLLHVDIDDTQFHIEELLLQIGLPIPDASQPE